MRDYKYSLEIMKQELENKYISPEIKYAFKVSIEALEKQMNNHWINVMDRLPTQEEYNKNDGRFIVTDGNRVYQSLFDIYEKKAFFELEYKGNFIYEDTVDNRVIGWRMLPELEKEDSNES